MTHPTVLNKKKIITTHKKKNDSEDRRSKMLSTDVY